MIWDVGNFYSGLESICEEGSEFSLSYFALVVTSALLATGGLLANNVPVIIGAMCAAPFLSPSRAVCVGWVYKKWNIVVKGLIKQLLGLLSIGSAVAFLVTLSLSHLVPDIFVTPETIARTIPTIKDVCLAMFIAMLSGVVASFVLVARRKMVSDSNQQVPSVNYTRLFDATIGVEIAISLIPPASVVGMGLAFGQFDLFHHSLGLLLVNVWGLNIGGVIVLYLWGIKPKPLQLEKKIRRVTEKTINDVVRAHEINPEVTLRSYNKADVYVRLHAFQIHDREYRSLAKTVSREIEKETGISNNVRIIATPVNVYTS